ncbi:30S ribosomal protein S1 [bacterium]|nr:MAG: 30S ribosomal protein S1 [bacterium]QQR61417.1 MAG: 30S ribosomal protein S1 [bacterium]QQR63062.1 MAG: 30S ribosomal protein S1 [bacterium]
MSKEMVRPQDFCAVKNKALFEDIDVVLSPEQEAELMALYSQAFAAFQTGKLVTGTVVTVDSDGVLVDIGYKSRGMIHKFEFSEFELKEIKAGQQIEVILDNLESPEGTVVLSYEKAKAMRSWNKIMELFHENKPVEGVVLNKVKGGLSVDVGVPAFLPGSQIDLQRITDFDQFVGQKIVASILKINKKRGNIIISRRKYLNDQRSEVRKQILDTLKQGQVIQGMVKNITNYGVFVDIGGVDGLLHITDMTWGRIAHPTEMVKIGDMISVKVLSFDEANQKISLGLKQLMPNPWEQLGQTLKVNDHVKGRISSITDYGLFVEVNKDIEGLVHISEISWTDRIADLKDRFHVGDEIEAIVVSLDIENRRMSLSIKRLEKNPWKVVGEQFTVGQRIKGKVSNITDFGIFVELLPGIDGLVHISDVSWTEHVQHPSDRYAVGQELEAVILAIDVDNKKVSLGIKQLAEDPWTMVEQQYTVGTLVEGKISKIANFGAFVRLPTGIEGLLHNTTLTQDEGKKAEQMFKVGDSRQFRVININKEEHKIGLSTNLEGRSGQYHQENRETHTVSRDEKPSRQVASGRKDRDNRQRTDDENVATSHNQNSKIKTSFQMALESAMAENKKDTNSEGN